MVEPRYIVIACDMLSCTSDQLDVDLTSFLAETNEYVSWVEKRGLESVQVIALAIATWRRLNPEQRPVIRGR